MSIIGVGVDIEAVKRFSLVEAGGRLINRIFTESERAYCDQQAVPARHYAARFAAKEAAVKALCTVVPQLTVSQVEIYKVDGSTAPLLRLVNGAELPGGITVHVSLSHADHYATAFVVAESV